MHFQLLALAGLLAPSALAAAVSPRAAGRFTCGTHEPTAEHLAISQALAVQEAQELQARAADGNFSIQATVNVDVWFHVLASSTSVADGYVSDATLANQLDVMNDAFAPHDIAFVHKGTTRTINSVWASDGAELAMKKALRKGTYKTLNVYFFKDLGSNFGYCYFPSNPTDGSNNWYYDGCSILSTTVPGGSETNFNLGHTATHEIGHWFGLYHTFQGGCTGAGDSVSDTPAQASATSGCPVGRDSCPNAAGVDPIHNFMDYSYDTCYEEFTPGQKTRMHSFWNQYRASR